MAEITDKSTLKPGFKNGQKPTQEQFWAWMDSYWHKAEKIPLEIIEDINTILSGKADKEVVDNLIEKLEEKAEKTLVESLQTYIEGLIDDTSKSSKTTYSSEKIEELIENVQPSELIDDELEEGSVNTYSIDKIKKLVENSPDVSLINDSLDKGSENTYSIDKIKTLIGNISQGNLIVENSTNEALSYEQLELFYPDFDVGDVVLCINVGFKYEKTQTGWIEYIIRKLEPSEPEFLEPLLFSNITSPNLDEISRATKIVITEIDKPNSRFKCDIENVALIKTQGVNGQPWFISQGNEASSFCEIVDIDEEEWVYYSTAWLGNMNINVGAAVEFFNPFTNYKILNNECPTFATAKSNTNTFGGYPTTLNGKTFKYLIHGGLLKKESDNNYKAFICAVGSGETFVAEDTDINGKFSIISQIPLFENVEYPVNRTKGSETLMWGITPVKKGFLTNHIETHYIGLLAVKDGQVSNTYKANYPGFILLNENGDIIKDEKIREAKLINTYLSTKSSWEGGWHITGLSLYKSNWHLIVKNWNQIKMSREEWHIIIDEKEQQNLISILEGDDLTVVKKAYLLHRGDDYTSTPKSIFYGQSDFNLFTYKDKLYCFYFFEPIQSGYVNSMNRMCGIAKWDNENQLWDYQTGMQLINPVQLFRKYSHLYWCYDHWGNLCCPYFENEDFFIATNIGSDAPDYFPAILKINLKESTN